MKTLTLAAACGMCGQIFLAACVLHPEIDDNCADTVLDLMNGFDELECEKSHNVACGPAIRSIIVVEDEEDLATINQVAPEPIEFLM